MRIDLHIHTQKCKQGDGSKRNITPEKFIEKMSKNNVKITINLILKNLKK